MTGHTVSILGSFNSMSCLPPAKRRRVHGLGHDWRRRTFSRMAVGGAFVLRGMPDGTIYPAQQAAARSRFRSCRMVRFIRHNKQLRVRTSVMSGGAIQPTQQAAARLCFGACRAVRFIQHNNRRRVRDSGHAGQYDSSSTTTGGAFVLRGMPGSTIHPAQQAAARRIALIHRAACQSRCTSHILLL